MPSGVIRRPGRAPTRSEQLLLVPLIDKKYIVDGVIYEAVVIHHITEDTTYHLQLEIERRVSRYGGQTRCFFERIWI